MRQKGVTLIALVITIIVLLILAGVAISSLSVDNSVPQKAREAKMMSDNSDEEDAVKMAVIEAVARGNDAQVSDGNLRATLEGVAKSITTNEDGTWTVVGPNGGIFKVRKNGSVKVVTAEVGDFVNYTAGNWTKADLKKLGVTYNEGETAITSNGVLYAGSSLPTSSTPYKFGGFAEGSSKDASITPYSTYANTYSGWRVLSVNADGTIKEIIHAGTPEGYYHPYGTNYAYKSQKILGGGTNASAPSTDPSDSSKTFASIAERDWSMYATGTYGSSARSVTKAEMDAISSSNTLRKTGSYYWLPLAGNSNGLWDVYHNGAMYNWNYGSFGVRPVVSLEPGVKVVKANATDTTHTTPATAWNLSK